MTEPVYKIAFWVPASMEYIRDAQAVQDARRYGWSPPFADPNPFPRLRLWRWWP